ncbi:biopolymer transporter ExbD [Erythrobacter sp. SG61-1L]|uniref:ExbD/TolR family protein n=1 Tax=Erythrobacter sp. SG61-1L TaxID=1603897 RepID=UPI0006C90016|nr:biopolymer transporter ExbD [Erythrobacter sp. SG61-1L]KPL68979.1 biopolymer transporter ExbD [Erythrobacter sp. SG61-1L]
MAFASPREAVLPLGEMNTTPLIDVMLVLLVMLIFTIPVATNSLDVDLPAPTDKPVTLQPNPIKNKIALTPDGSILWNGTQTDRAGLRASLKAARELYPEPELQYEPDAQASYDLAARVLSDIKASGATKFGFVGNDRYRSFEKQN